MENPLRREEFLNLVTKGALGLSGLLGLAGLVRYLDYQPPAPPPKRYEVGEEIDFPLGSRTVLADIPAVLIHSRDGFRAISLVCTHLGCTVESKAGGFACQCHGSVYDKDGNVTKGPAVEPLPPLGVEVQEDGTVVVIKG